MKKVLGVLKKGLSKVKDLVKFPFVKYKKLKKPIRRLICLVLAAGVGFAGFKTWQWYTGSEETAAKASGTSIVRQGNLTNSITGSGTVEPIEQREIIPEVNGKIIESDFEEGESVLEGDVLYRFEMTAAENAIESAQNSVEKAQTTLSNRQSNLTKIQENIEKLTIKATNSGKISGISLRVGEDASGKICTITNFKEQTATIPFSSAHINSISVGDSANVSIDKYMINTTGKVVRKYTASDTLPSGAVVYYVEIRLSEDYLVEENINVTATVNSKGGNISSASYGSVKYADPVTVNAEQKGKVSKVNFKNGDWVEEGQVIAVLKNTDLNDDLRTAQQNVKEAQMNLTEALNNLEDKQEEANEYIVTSPINGVILTKDYFVGDTIGGQNPPSLMVVADMSKMKFTISADELDISKIQLGQSVSVTADALARQRLRGRITAVSKLGTASNGVTNYPIEVTIDQPGELMPGMNVNAQIIVEQSFNCLYLPTEAVEYFDGKYYVTIVGEVENMPEPSQQGGFGGRGMWGGGRPGTQNEEENGQKTEQSGENTPETPNEQNAENRGGRGQRPYGGNGGRGQRPGAENGTNTSENTASSEEETTQTPSAPESGQGPRGGRGGRYPQNTQGAENRNSTGQPSENRTESPADNKPDSGDKNANASESRKGGNGGPGGKGQQEELKIKYYEKETRVEVKIGIKTDNAYEILEGVKYGQVVKNTVQITQSGAQTNGMRGGMGGGFGGGMGGGFGGGFGGGNRNNRGNFGGGNRNSGGRR